MGYILALDANHGDRVCCTSNEILRKCVQRCPAMLLRIESGSKEGEEISDISFGSEELFG